MLVPLLNQKSRPPAPAGVIEGSRVDVSFIAGLLVDKFCHHLPLYRQHQRLAQAGVKVSRPWLTLLAQSAIALLEPVFGAQWRVILALASSAWTKRRSRPDAKDRAR